MAVNEIVGGEGVYKRKKALNFYSAFAPAGIKLLNLWNDFRKVVRFIDENQWIRPPLEKIVEMKNRDNV